METKIQNERKETRKKYRIRMVGRKNEGGEKGEAEMDLKNGNN